MKHEPRSSRFSLAAFDVARDDDRYTCKDGVMTAADVGRAAGISAKSAKRAMQAKVAEDVDARSCPGGIELALEKTGIPVPCTQTRAQMAVHVARHLGLGVFGLKRRIEERAAAAPKPKPKEKRVSTEGHPWKAKRHGRAFRSNPAGGGIVATLTCSRCPAHLDISFRNLANADTMDRKFADKGWALDPARCPTHNRRNHQPRKDPPVTTEAPTFAAPSPAAIAANAKMFTLLQTHFDPESGTYGSGYSDAKIAEECKLALDLVAGIRKQAFGELKVPNEVAQLTLDIEALEQLLNENVDPIRVELGNLKRRVAECCKKFGG